MGEPQAAIRRLPEGARLNFNHPMQLTDEQKQKVATWMADGLKLSDIQALAANATCGSPTWTCAFSWMT